MSDDLLTLVPSFSNLYVPPWVPLSAQLPGFRDDEYSIDLPAVTVNSGASSLGNVLPFDADTDYFIRELWFVILPTTASAVQPSDLRVRIRDGDGHMFTNDFCYAQDLCGPLCPPWPVRAGATLIVDYQNQNTGEVNIVVQLVLRGYKRKACENVAVPLPSLYVPMRKRYAPPNPGETHRDFAYSQSYSGPAAPPAPSTLLKFPIQMDNDADFIWRGLAGSWATVNNTEGGGPPTVGGVALTFYDASNTPFNQLQLPEPWGGFAGEQRESILTNGGMIAPQFPEVRVPRGGLIQVDVSFGTLATVVRLALRGVKVYAEGTCK